MFYAYVNVNRSARKAAMAGGLFRRSGPRPASGRRTLAAPGSIHAALELSFQEPQRRHDHDCEDDRDPGDDVLAGPAGEPDGATDPAVGPGDRTRTRPNSSHSCATRLPSSA